ncbi:MAG: hypothetical protein ACJAZW_001180 [Maritalea sp.]|jgi:hypothetical protein
MTEIKWQVHYGTLICGKSDKNAGQIGGNLPGITSLGVDVGI